MSLITAIVDTVSLDFVPDEVAAARKQMCRKCAFNRGIGSCIKCGCLVAWKVWMPQESCPVNKWGEFKEETNE